jgi:uncharacterized protein (DUF924 family)
MPHATDLPTPDVVLTYWFGNPLQTDWPTDDRSALWFGGGAALDADITARFGPLLQAALDGQLLAWQARPDTRLALVLVLDQFCRNVHRGQARAFAGDAPAQALVRQALAEAQDSALPTMGRVFLYMPLMHAESVALQHACVSRFTDLVAQAPQALADRLQGHLKAARQHRDIVQTFGRFPHRNAVLGRTSTPAEAAFLKDGPRFGQ